MRKSTVEEKKGKKHTYELKGIDCQTVSKERLLSFTLTAIMAP